MSRPPGSLRAAPLGHCCRPPTAPAAPSALRPRPFGKSKAFVSLSRRDAAGRGGTTRCDGHWAGRVNRFVLDIGNLEHRRTHWPHSYPFSIFSLGMIKENGRYNHLKVVFTFHESVVKTQTLKVRWGRNMFGDPSKQLFLCSEFFFMNVLFALIQFSPEFLFFLLSQIF